MDDSPKAWFLREILPHEESLTRYLILAWPKYDEVHDLRQEIYVRIYDAARASRPTQPRAFLFATARHLMADRIRRKRVVSIESVGDIEKLNVLVDQVSVEQRVNARQELRRVVQAFDQLPPRCREVVWMRRVNDVPQKEVAERLGITQKSVEKHVIKGARLLAEWVYGRGERDRNPQDTSGPGTENEHGQQHSD